MKKGTVSKLLSITLALSMTLGSGSLAVFADDEAPAAEEIETAVAAEDDAEAEAVVTEEAEAATEEASETDTEIETVVQPETETATPADAAQTEVIVVKTTSADDAAEIAVVADEETEQEDAALAEEEEFSGYVLMNIPYAKFYEAEGTSDVDAVSSATLNKPRTGALAGGSYHVNADGSDITGVIYPVYVNDKTMLADYDQITDESTIDITVTNKGKETTTTYAGKDALFEAPSYSYYILKETPAFYKTLNNDGSFSAVAGEVQSVTGVTGDVKVGGKHTDIEIKLTGTEGIDSGTTVSGVILTDTEENKYGMRHVYNVWKGTELGWNTNEKAPFGKTITNIRYYTQNAVVDYPVEISIPQKDEIEANIVNSVKELIETAKGSFGTAAEAQKAVDAAKKAYEKLTNERKAMIPDAESSLEAAQKAATEQKETEDQAAADNAEALIKTANGKFETAADAQKAVDAAKNAFATLSEVQKALLLKVMPDAENQLTNAQTAATAQKTAEENAAKKDDTKTENKTDNKSVNPSRTVTKQSQSLKKLTPATKKLKVSRLKKKKQTFKLKATINGQGKVTFRKVSGNKKIKISKAGKVTVKKGLKKGTYKVKVQVSIAASGNYTAASAVKTIKIKVK